MDAGFGEGLSIVKWLRDPRVAALFLGGAVLSFLLLSGVAFAADQATSGGKVARNVSVGGRNVSSATPVQLVTALAEVDRRYSTTEVVVGGTDGFSTDAGSIGLRVDSAATVERVMATGRQGSLPGRWWSWLGSFHLPARRSPVRQTGDPMSVRKDFRVRLHGV